MGLIARQMRPPSLVHAITAPPGSPPVAARFIDRSLVRKVGLSLHRYVQDLCLASAAAQPGVQSRISAVWTCVDVFSRTSRRGPATVVMTIQMTFRADAHGAFVWQVYPSLFAFVCSVQNARLLSLRRLVHRLALLPPMGFFHSDRAYHSHGVSANSYLLDSRAWPACSLTA